MSAQQLTENVVMGLVEAALPLFYSASSGYVAHATHGASMVASGEPVADLNYLVLRHGSDAAVSAFASYVKRMDKDELPFAAMVAPAALDAGKPVCESLGLVYGADWPLMVCSAEAVRDYPVDGLEVRKPQTAADFAGSAAVLASAFSMPEASVRRAVPPEQVESPAVDIYVAVRDERVLSTVTVTFHGPVAGIWAMGTHGEAQGQGVGKALLSRVMGEGVQRGIETFFLGATPTGFPLYERLGYRHNFSAQIWVRGESNQL